MLETARPLKGQRQQAISDHQDQARATTQALVSEWGNPNSEEFKANQEYFHKAVNALGGEGLMDELYSSGIIDNHDQIMMPGVVLALAKAGRDLFSEDHMVTGQGGGRNPFAEDSKNWGEQNAIIRDDPQHARNLIRAAGKDPRTYKL